MEFKDLIRGIVLFLVLLLFSSLFAYFRPTNLGCEELNGKERDICFLKLAKEKEDTNYCFYIEDHRMSGLCSTEVWGIGDCFYEGMINAEPDDCYLKKALNTLEINYCYPIKNGSRDICFEEISREAIKQKNMLLCGESTTCQRQVSETTNDCYLLEGLMGSTSKLIPPCLLRRAMETRNESICNEIPEGNIGLRSTCSIFFLSEEEIYELCPSAEIFDNFHECTFSTAKRHNNSRYCDMITEENIGKYNLNKTTTDHILSFYPPLCKILTAKFNKNKEPCNHILDDGFKNLCLASFETEETCLTLPSEELKNSCMAMITMDKHHCEKILDFNLNDICQVLHETVIKAH